MRIRSCHCCGLAQTVAPTATDRQPVCQRCATPLGHGNPGRNRWAAALAASALAFYPPAMILPMLRIDRLGHAHEDSLVSGVIALWSQGYWFIGTLVFTVSVLLPPLKLALLWILSGSGLIARHQHRALAYRLVELLGRWGMLDVLLVAILVAFVKLGDLVNIHAGPGLSAFALLVLLSLLAGAVFNPLLMWDDSEDNP
jgi:paraquat-inducible protein A